MTVFIVGQSELILLFPASQSRILRAILRSLEDLWYTEQKLTFLEAQINAFEDEMHGPDGNLFWELPCALHLTTTLRKEFSYIIQRSKYKEVDRLLESAKRQEWKEDKSWTAWTVTTYLGSRRALET
jgi:hypothetical protein